MKTYTYRVAAATLNSNRENFAPWIRDGAIIYLTEDKPREVPSGTPAWYLPFSGDIYVCVNQIFETMHGTIGPNTLDRILRDMSGPAASRFIEEASTPDALTAATIVGLIQHEAAHSEWSRWTELAGDDFAKASAAANVVMQFEELRIESRVIEYRSKADDKVFALSGMRRPLQLSFAWLCREATDSFFESGTKRDVAGAWSLIYGRHLAGVVEEKTVEGIHLAAETRIGVSDLAKLESILVEAIALPPVAGIHKRLLELAERWLKVVGEEGEGEVSSEAIESTSGGGDGDGDGDADVDPSSGGAEDADEDEDDSADEDGSEDVDGDGPSSPARSGIDAETEDGHGRSDELPEVLDSLSKSIAEEILKPVDKTLRLADSKTEARLVLSGADDFGQVKPSGYTFSGDYYGISRWQEVPSASDRNTVAKIARQLERISLPAVTKKKLPHELPPGRVNMRQAMAASVERERGAKITAKPWKKTKRTHTETKPTIIGIMTDVSGSMGWAVPETAKFGYVFSNAGARVSARSAVVAFGSDVEIMVRPGERLDKLRFRYADGGTEMFDRGAAALDGVLHLTEMRNAVRLVMVTSDGVLVRPKEIDRALLWVERWRKAGVHIVWCGFNAHHEKDFRKKLEDRGVIIDSSHDLVDAGMRALTRFV